MSSEEQLLNVTVQKEGHHHCTAMISFGLWVWMELETVALQLNTS